MSTEPTQMNNLLEAALLIAAAITTLYGAGTAILRMVGPFKKINERLAQHDKLLESDHLRLQRYEAGEAVILESLFVLLEQMPPGECGELAESASKRLQKYLLERK